MPNRLADESSPYLQQHAENPVDWFAWGAEAFDLARAQDKPVLLSIGYADRKSTRLNSSHERRSRMPSSA